MTSPTYFLYIMETLLDSRPFRSSHMKIPCRHHTFSHYQQLISYLQTCYSSQVDPLQKRFIDVVHQRDDYYISSFYSQLITHQSDKYHLAPLQKWSAIFNDTELPEKILNGYRYIHKLTVAETWWETQFKIIHRAYHPFRTSMMNSTQSQCPQCRTLSGTGQLYPLTGTLCLPTFLKSTGPGCPRILYCAYWDVKYQLPHLLKQWTHICLLVARRTIMCNWIKSSLPFLPAVKWGLLSLFNLERLDTIVLNSGFTHRFFSRWLKYMEFTFTHEELSSAMCPFQYTDWYLK